MKIHEKIRNLPQSERASFKGQEIAKAVISVARTNVKFSGVDLDIEIVSTKAILSGIEILARAWKDGVQIGFGKDGTVDLERFRILNPPILVSDESGDIIQDLTDRTGVPKQRKLIENPKEALLQSLVHTIKVKIQKFGNENIIPGKVGNTTTTVYPNPGNPGTTSVDGYVGNTGENTTFATVRSGAGDTVNVTTSSGLAGEIDCSGTTDNFGAIYRGIYLFDTSSIPDTDNIDSATLSLFGNTQSNTAGHASPENDVTIVSTAPASNTTLAASDFNIASWTMTQQNSTDIAYASWSLVAYNDFALNATGVGNISKTGITKFGATFAGDRTGTCVGCVADGTGFLTAINADLAGTSSDPKLVVEHSEEATTNSNLLLMGVG